MTRLGYLDGWRGLAILTVLFGHFTPFSKFGGLGVEIFFVLSGRLMAEILFVEKYPLPTFFQRRISRIMPGLAVFVLAMLLASPILQAVLHRDPIATPLEALAAITFTMNYAVVYGHMESILVHTWSLAVEEHSYLLLAILAWLTRRNSRAAACFLILGFLLCVVNGLLQAGQYTGSSLNHDVYWRTDVRAGTVFLAAGLHLLLRGWAAPRLLGPILLLVGILLGVQDPTVACTFGSVALALSVATLQSAPSLFLKALSWLPLTRLGIWSFSIYLWQQPFYFGKQFLPAPICFIGAIVAGVASFYFVEQPARRFINGLNIASAIKGMRYRVSAG